MAGPYLTVRAGSRATAELVDRKSRFIAVLAHVESADEAAGLLAAERSAHYDARHHVPAWILSDGTERSSDDGEPQRTAGLPVLDVLRGEGLADVCCVVTRYFGGVLLGPGGLVRAYSGATRMALDAARDRGLLAEMTQVVGVEATIPYALYDRVRDLARRLGAREAGSDFAAGVTLRLTFRAGEQQAFLDALREVASGRDLCQVGEPRFAEF